jgi:hypothetical protein
MLTRREMLARTSTGFGTVALAGLLAEDAPATGPTFTSSPTAV